MGYCHHGAACTYLHEAADIAARKARHVHGTGASDRAKQRRGVCKYFLEGTCKFGELCFFVHEGDEGRMDLKDGDAGLNTEQAPVKGEYPSTDDAGGVAESGDPVGEDSVAAERKDNRGALLRTTADV